jgi:hypothetical protein
MSFQLRVKNTLKDLMFYKRVDYNIQKEEYMHSYKLS